MVRLILVDSAIAMCLMMPPASSTASARGLRGEKLIITANLFEKVEGGLKIAITRGRPPAGWKWMPELAPSQELFREYLVWRRKGLWPKMWPEYEEKFRKEMEVKRALLEKLAQVSKTKNIILGCFCKTEIYCHRRLVAEEIRRLL